MRSNDLLKAVLAILAVAAVLGALAATFAFADLDEADDAVPASTTATEEDTSTQDTSTPSSGNTTTTTTTSLSTTTTTFPNLKDSPEPGPFVNSPEAIAYDMFGPAIGTEDAYQGGGTDWGLPWPNHEEPIQRKGTKYQWLTGGLASKWNVPGEEQAIYARCKVVPAAGGVGPSGFTLQIRGLESYQRIDGQWFLHQSADSAGLDGDWFRLSNFFSDGRIGDTLERADEAGVWETPWPAKGEIFHFFMGKNDLPRGEIRKLFDPDYDPSRDTFFATAQMRIVPGDDKSINLSEVRLLGNCGLDFYRNETSTRRRDYDGPVPSGGHPRSKLLTTEWQAFNWYTLPLDQPAMNGDARTWPELRQAIIDDPPPINR